MSKSFQRICFSFKRKITSNNFFRDIPQEIFSVRFSYDGSLLATGCNDGVVRVYNGKTGGSVLQTLRPSPEDGGPLQGTDELSVQLPISAMRFRPGGNSRGVLLACSADSSVRHWHVPTGKCLSTIFEGGDQQVFACDYRHDGQVFATGGKDKRVRLYDESRSSSSGNSGIGSSATVSAGRTLSSSSAPAGSVPIATFGGGLFAGTSIETLSSNPSSNDTANGAGGSHSNRIFAVCFHPLESDILLSGGWDNTIQIWDSRISGAGHGAVRSLFGADLCGDALQVSPDGNYVISGSWRPDDALQVWDFRSGRLVSSIPFLRSNSEVNPYLNAVAKVRNSNGPFKSSVRDSVPLPPPPVNHSLSPSSTLVPILPTPTIPDYEKPDPTLLYSISFSKNTVSGEGRSPGYYLFAGGSGINGGKVFQTQDLISCANEISATRARESLSAIYSNQEVGCLPEGTERSPSTRESSTPIHARTCRPLVASISGLSRGVFASDWDGNSGLVIVGGDQPIRVFDVNTSLSKVILVGAGGGAKDRGRVGSLKALATETNEVNTASTITNATEVISLTNPVISEFSSSDAKIFVSKSAIPPAAPPVSISTVKPPPVVLLALAAANAAALEAIEVSNFESSYADNVKARQSLSTAAVASEEAELIEALATSTSSAWGEEIKNEPKLSSMCNDETEEDEESTTFNAGHRKIINPHGLVNRAIRPQPSTHPEEALEVRVRRSSGSVDAFRALIEGTREKDIS